MKQLIISALVAMMFASCTQSYNINGQYYDLGRLQETGVDSVIVAEDPRFVFDGAFGSSATYAADDDFLIFSKGTSIGGKTRYYLCN